jgi:hypothetical protein
VRKEFVSTDQELDARALQRPTSAWNARQAAFRQHWIEQLHQACVDDRARANSSQHSVAQVLDQLWAVFIKPLRELLFDPSHGTRRLSNPPKPSADGTHASKKAARGKGGNQRMRHQQQQPEQQQPERQLPLRLSRFESSSCSSSSILHDKQQQQREIDVESNSSGSNDDDDDDDEYEEDNDDDDDDDDDQDVAPHVIVAANSISATKRIRWNITENALFAKLLRECRYLLDQSPRGSRWSQAATLWTRVCKYNAECHCRSAAQLKDHWRAMVKTTIDDCASSVSSSSSITIDKAVSIDQVLDQAISTYRTWAHNGSRELLLWPPQQQHDNDDDNNNNNNNDSGSDTESSSQQQRKCSGTDDTTIPWNSRWIKAANIEQVRQDDVRIARVLQHERRNSTAGIAGTTAASLVTHLPMDCRTADEIDTQTQEQQPTTASATAGDLQVPQAYRNRRMPRCVSERGLRIRDELQQQRLQQMSKCGSKRQAEHQGVREASRRRMHE